MNLPNQTLKIEFAKIIDGFYEFAGYEIDKDKVIRLVDIIFTKWPDITIKQFNQFIDDAISGKCGMIYSSPISFMVAFDSFYNRNKLTMP